MLKSKTFGKRLRDVRIERKWSQTEMAAKLGVTQPMISKWERQRANPRLATVRRLAGVLGVRSYWLAFGDFSRAESSQIRGNL